MKYKILLLDTKPSNPNHYICIAIEEALKNNPEVEFVFKANLGNALTSAKLYNCNLFFAFDGENLNPEICSRLRKTCGLSVAWFTEDPYELPNNIANSDLFDIIFTNDYSSVKSYKTLAFHLPFAASKLIQFQKVAKNEACLYDLFFCGTAWPNRVKTIAEILKKTKKLKLKIGLPTNEHLPPINLPLSPSSYSWKTPNSEFARIASLSRISLSIHRDFSTHPGAKTLATTPGPRLFEIGMAGGFQLFDSTLSEIEKYLEPNKEIITFDNADDCVEKLNFYLGNPKKRVEIAKAAQKRILNEHTYKNRVSFIIDKIGKHRINNIKNKNTVRPKILVVCHNIINLAGWGGVEIYTEWIRKNLSSKFDLLFYTPEAPKPHLKNDFPSSYLLLDEKLKLVSRIKAKTFFNRQYLTCPEREMAFSKIIIDHQISCVHFQHLLHHPPSLPIIAKSLGIGVMLSLHDYYCICDNYNLIGSTQKYCQIETQTLSGCDSCLSHTHHAEMGSQSIRRNFFSRVLEACDVIQTNVEDVKKRFELIYGKSLMNKKFKTQVIAVPIEKQKKTMKYLHGQLLKKLSSENLNVAIIGNFTREKGAQFFFEIFKLTKNFPINFFIFGRIHQDLVDHLKDQTFSKVYIHGQYKHDDLNSLLNKMHVSMHNSIWPETYCLTLSEAWNAGLVPIVSDIGALGERVQDQINGYKFPPENIGKAVDILTFLSNNMSELVKVKQGNGQITYANEHFKWLKEQYSNLSVSFNKVQSKKRNDRSELTLRDCGVYLNSPMWLK